MGVKSFLSNLFTIEIGLPELDLFIRAKHGDRTVLSDYSTFPNYNRRINYLLKKTLKSGVVPKKISDAVCEAGLYYYYYQL